MTKIYIFFLLIILLSQSYIVFASQYDIQEIESRAEEQYEVVTDKSKTIYEQARKNIEKDLKEVTNAGFGKGAFITFYKIYSFIKSVAPIAVGLSILTGLFLYIVVRKNKFLIRKIFIICFLFIPIFITAFYFIIGSFIG